MAIEVAREFFFFFSSRRRHTRFDCDWSSDVCSSDLPWLELGIQCPRCGNHGEPDGPWEANAWIRLIEEVVRSWEFRAESANGALILSANVEDESVDWESDTNLRFECMQRSEEHTSEL